MIQYTLEDFVVNKKNDDFAMNIVFRETQDGKEDYSLYGLSFSFEKGKPIEYLEEIFKRLARSLHRLKYEDQEFLESSDEIEEINV